MSHLCVFFAYRNIKDIILSFESLYLYDIDYFVVENYSENSKEIKNFFLSKKLKGYIQFKENISGNAINIFLKEYYEFIKKYDYITITDADLVVVNAAECFSEIKNNLKEESHGISSVDLYMGNHYNREGKNRIVGLDPFIEQHYKTNRTEGSSVKPTGISLATFKRECLDIVKSVYFRDNLINDHMRSVGKKWVCTRKNLAYHLTWDLYVDGNDYYEWKKSVFPGIWHITTHSDYIKII